MSKNALGEDNKRTPAYEDLSAMPFGKHQGVKLQDVPATYLSWLWHNGKKGEQDKLANYIWNSRHALNQDLENTDSEPIA